MRRIHQCWAAVAALVLSVGCAKAQEPSTRPVKAPGHYVETLKSGKLDRSFILKVPKAYTGKPVPVVVVLHGWTASAAIAEAYTNMGEKAEKEGFVAVFPDGVGNPKGWNADFINLAGSDKPDDVAFVGDVLDQVEKEINVDLDRVFVCGHSNGAFLTNLIGAKLSLRFAAIGSVAGTIGVGNKRIPTPVAPLSVILIHGKKDPTVWYGDEKVSALLKGVGAEEAAEWWAKQDACNPDSKSVTSPDGKFVTETFTGGRNDAEVVLVSINEGKHDWPTLSKSGLDAADTLWQFFKTHARRRS